jgi:hypothetical protein
MPRSENSISMKPTRLYGAAMLGLIAVSFFGGSVLYAFKSRYTTGLESANWGDVPRAFALENLSVCFALSGLASATVAIALIFRHMGRDRATAIAWAVVIGALVSLPIWIALCLRFDPL